MIGLFTSAEVAGALTWEPVVSAWHGADLLANHVPVAGGSITWSTHREVPGSLDLVVPRESVVNGRPFDWLPSSEADPLSYHGQVLVVALRVTTPISRRSETIPYGRFMVTDFEDAGGAVRVTGVSLSQRIVEQRFATPTPSRPDGSFVGEVRRIIPGSLGVVVDPLLTDRLVPAMSWPEDRMAAVRELAEAWPARVREDMTGVVRFLPPLGEPGPPVLHLTDMGVDATVASAYRSGKREGIYNSVVARGQETDEAGHVAHQAEVSQSGGPYDVDRFGLVRRFFTSPLLTSHEAAVKAATTILADSIRPATTLPVVCAADPRIELDDLMRVTSDGRTSLGWVSGFQIPLVPDSPMRVDVEKVWEG